MELGYSPLSVTRSRTAMGIWADGWNGVHVDQLDANAVMAFLAAHVKDRRRLPTAGVLPLLDYLRAAGFVAPEPAKAPAALDRLMPITRRGCWASASWRRRRCEATRSWRAGSSPNGSHRTASSK